MTRAIKIYCQDSNLNRFNFTVKNINTDTTVAQCYQFATKTVSLSANTYITSEIIDTTPVEVEELT